MQIEWSEIEPTDRDRGIVQRALVGLAACTRVVLSRKGSGFEARVMLDLREPSVPAKLEHARTLRPACAARQAQERTPCLRLHAESLAEVVDRAAELVGFVTTQRAA